MLMRCYKKQQGLALLLFMLVLMSIGGVLLIGSLQKAKQEVESTRYQHNKRILNEAKQMLLFHAYRYPNFNSESKGPGYLPCPYDTETGYSGSISTIICEAVGRFPYNLTNLGFHEVKDASGERLWYAVSKNFYTLGSTTFINSNTKGTISIYDQAENLIYDGTVDGIAAIIIAPGPRINRDDNGDEDFDYEQVRITSANKLNPKNYLDAFNGFDNATFLNGSNTLANSFILGGNFNAEKNDVVINDQIMIVTTEEVLEMAKKSVLEQYSFAIKDYLAIEDNSGDPINVYPWLFDYATTDINTFPVGAALTNIGRIPSIFSSYFENTNSQAISSEIGINIKKNFELSRGASSLPVSISLNITSTAADNVKFTKGVSEESLSADATGEFFETYKFYWDDVITQDGWELCMSPATNVSDCNRNPAGVLTGSSGNFKESQILRVGLSLDLSSNMVFIYSVATTSPISPTAKSFTAAKGFPPAIAAEHAKIKANFTGTQVSTTPVKLFYEQMDSYGMGSPSFVVDSSDEQDIANNVNFGDIVLQSLVDMALELRYYPELPLWAAPNKSDWNSRIQMAIATEYQPGGNAADCATHVDGCLQISDLGGINDNKIAVLVVSGQGEIFDEATDGFFNDIGDIFDVENADLDFILTGNVLTGNDRILVIQEE